MSNFSKFLQDFVFPSRFSRRLYIFLRFKNLFIQEDLINIEALRHIDDVISWLYIVI